MARQVIAILAVVLWVALFGQEFLQAVDLSMDASAHGSVKATLAALGEAMEASEDGEEKALYKPSVQPKVFDPLLTETISDHWSKKGSRLKKADPEIYKLHHAFLI
jgi:hypothetical protein